MNTQQYLAGIDREEISRLLDAQDYAAAMEKMTLPLHEALYKRQSFDLLDELPAAQRLLLVFDYISSQVGQGGFIQLIQNGYLPLLLTAIETLQELNISPEMIKVLDDVLKVFVLNKEALGRETTVEEFSKLYEEFKEFDVLEEGFNRFSDDVIKAIIKKLLQED